jgi:hypothetical protein
MEMLRRQMTDLIKQVERLSERLEEMTPPRDASPPGLQMMQVKFSEMARDMDKVAELPEQFRRFDSRLASVQEQIKALHASSDGLPTDSIGGRTPSLTVGSAISMPVTPTGSRNPINPTIEQGISQLERGEFALARATFSSLQAVQPDDARVWYLSALAEGLTSGNWDGEAKRFAEKGLECERAGHPSTSTVDLTLATRTAVKGEAWLASLRAGMRRTRDGER